MSVHVVLDTNVWVSALLWRGLPWEILRLTELGHVTVCVPASMLLEIREVLSARRFRARLAQLGITPTEITAYVISTADLFIIAQDDAAITADPDDDAFLRCAVAAGAHYVISGDRHLLNLREFERIPIVNVRDFLSREFPDKVT